MKSLLTLGVLITIPTITLAQEVTPKPDLSDFSFLVGSHKCLSKTYQRDGSVDEHTALWDGQYILDGFAIADAYREIDENGTTIRRGSNFRSYDSAANKWVMRWFDPEASSWMALGMDDKGGVKITDDKIMFEADVPDLRWKIEFNDITDKGFIWKGSASLDDGENWYDGVQIIHCTRTE
ncbi:hypothetical protein [Pseudemcibacter aquimaris]|uniref:hypothetical protein n=1 Tax=Pseudemcibacter aquimaris TaxID=2857064 RepID=UPI0020125215|nr:hypothetical protein [Pseudemcibacter aquimaris]MCC3860113.1 hypothetical protein [Pseudemcibacter aquimaris]WDU57441.1 hypothetical protein KW060_09550 [Pseudemcibacter aquimaris]